MIGVRASVSMGDTRSIRVFVMGEANRPGSYTVSGLATITSALYAAGGVKPIGSLRDIQLKRQGAVVRRLDLYDLLLRGDTSDDAKLLPGRRDLHSAGRRRRWPSMVKCIGPRSTSSRATPASPTSCSWPVDSPAKPTPVASRWCASTTGARAWSSNVPLDGAAGRGELLRNGDSLRVLRLRPTLDQGVTVEGHVFRPGQVAWHEGLRLTDVLGSVDELRPNADLNYVLIRRELPPDRRIVDAVGRSRRGAARARLRPKNVELMPRDRIIVFDTESGRRAAASIRCSRKCAGSRASTSPAKSCASTAASRRAATIHSSRSMRVSDLLRAGGGLQDAAYGAKAELTRYRISGDVRQTQLIEVDLAAILQRRRERRPACCSRSIS